MIKFITLLIFIIAFCIGSISAASSFSFKKYQVEDGLSHNTVYCGMQDSYGFIWLGTGDGLNCYDGRANKVYRYVLNAPFSLENSFVLTLLEDYQHVWVGTNGGLYQYDRKSERFTPFEKKTRYGVFISSEVRKIIKTKSGLLWIATLGQGLFIYDPEKDVLTQNSLQASFVWDLCESDAGHVYTSSLQEGLLCFNENGSFQQSHKLSFGTVAPDSYKINCLLPVGDEIWIGAGSNSLRCFDIRTGQMECFDASFLKIGSIRCLLEYSKTEVMVGTDNGLYLFDRTNRGFVRIDSPSDSRSLSDQSINALMQDAEGGVWVLTNLGGVNYLAKQTKRFDYYPSGYYGGTTHLGKVIGPFYEDAVGNIWIGTRSGLCFLDLTTEQLKEYPVGASDKKYDIRSLLLDDNHLWVGTYSEGLKRVDLQTGHVKIYNHSRNMPNTICSNDVLAVYKDRKGEIFVGTSWGLCRYNPQADNFSTITTVGSMVSVVDIHEDMYGSLWIATSNSGVFRCNTENGHWKHFQHDLTIPATITSNSVITLFEDVKGTMWFGTNGGGLCSFNSKTETFVDFDTQNTLLPNKVIYSIEQDRAGDFWISSNAGLVKINPISKKRYRQFTVDDGLQGNQFCAQSSLRSSTGRFYFGGINGFNSFVPNRVTDNNYIPPVYITHIRLPYMSDEQAVKELLRLDEPLYMARRITLPYEHNSFSISFAALSYENPAKNRYSYLLKGVDKEWIKDSETNMASYTSLPPGEYEFQVRGSNNDHHWNDKTTTLLIVITPPWWRTTLAYILYALCLLSLTYYAAWRWNRRIKLKYKQQMEDYQTIKEKEVYRSKISFFINLVHEIRTPLSLIRLPLEKMLEEEQEGKNQKYLSVIDKNVNYLLGVTNQLLDFQKMENGSLQLHLKACNIGQLVSDVYNQFTSPAELKGVVLTLELPAEELVAAVDKEKISKIMVNLLSNAIKHAHSRIEVIVKLIDAGFEIQINDDGSGIPDAEKAKVFEAFYQLSDGHSSAGTGIGLAFSKSLAEGHHGALSLADSLQGGSSFILSLPLLDEEAVPEMSDVVLEEPMTETADTHLLPSEFSAKKFTVLLVEDNVDLLNLTAESLSVWFRVVKAKNGKFAQGVLERESVDVIVSDVMMPEMDGMELTELVKSNVSYSHIPVILLTAKTALESKIEGFECGADVYVEKPFSIKQLHKQIENLLKLRLAFHLLMSSLSGNTVNTSEFALSQRDCEFIADIQKAMAEQLADENFSIDNLADAMNMSRSNFYRKIKALSGMAPNDYLKTFRLNRSAELIKEGVRIAEVCERVGFSSSSYFAKCFKVKFGVLPKDYGGSVNAGNLPGKEKK